jgi:F-type H+-transporting ATPase subunit b
MEKFIHEFGIDWRLLLAQLVNFAVLVFILSKFAYKPILNALENRRKKIEEGIAYSEKAKAELENIETLKEESIRESEKKSLLIIKQAENSAQKTRGEILSEADKEREKIIISGQKLLSEEKLKLEKGFYQEAVTVVSSALGKVLSKKDFSKEEELLISQAINEIQTENT